jgi:hypothetical protein
MAAEANFIFIGEKSLLVLRQFLRIPIARLAELLQKIYA